MEGYKGTRVDSLSTVLYYIYILSHTQSVSTVGSNLHGSCAGIFKQSMGARHPSRNRLVVPARQVAQPGGIGSLESSLGLLKSLKIRALDTPPPPPPYVLYMLQNILIVGQGKRATL